MTKRTYKVTERNKAAKRKSNRNMVNPFDDYLCARCIPYGRCMKGETEEDAALPKVKKKKPETKKEAENKNKAEKMEAVEMLLL